MTNFSLESLRRLNIKGTYTLVIFLPREKRVTVGRLGRHLFPSGYYAYTGSAQGQGALNLGGRVERHLKKGKKKRWHIDYLLSAREVKAVSVIAAKTGKNMECEVNGYLKEKLRADVPVPKFGASDCKSKCGSHLLYLGLDVSAVRRIPEVYEEMFQRFGEIYLMIRE